MRIMLEGKEQERSSLNPGVLERWSLCGLAATSGNHSFILNFMEGEPLLLERAGHNLLTLFKRELQHDKIQNSFSSYSNASLEAGLVLMAENRCFSYMHGKQSIRRWAV